MGFKIIDLYRILNTISHVYQNKKYNLNENEIVVPLFKEPEICNKLSFIELGEQEFKIWDVKNKLLNFNLSKRDMPGATFSGGKSNSLNFYFNTSHAGRKIVRESWKAR